MPLNYKMLGLLPPFFTGFPRSIRRGIHDKLNKYWNLKMRHAFTDTLQR